MDRSEQYRKNARDERLWMAEAREDKDHLQESADRYRSMGKTIRTDFMQHESNIAGSFMRQRRAILEKEVRLGKR